MYGYEDERYRELEDELYQDQESNGSRSGSVDSEVEEQLWSNVLYNAGMDEQPKPVVVVTDGSETVQRNEPVVDRIVLHDSDEEGEIIEENAERTGDVSDVDDSRYESISKQRPADISSRLKTPVGRRGSDSSSSAEEAESAVNGSAVAKATPKKTQIQTESSLMVTKIIDLNQIAVQPVIVPDSSAYDYLDAATGDGPSRYFLPQSESMVCRKCNQVGHKARDCQAKKCNNCGELGHFADSCTHLSVAICHNCNRRGHINRDCPEPKRRGGVEKCHRCSSWRHHTDECPATWRLYVQKETSSPPGELRPWCFNCASSRHFGDSCELPRSNVYNGSGNIESAFSDLHVAKKRRGENDVAETDVQRRAREAKEDLIRSEINRFRSGGKSTSNRNERHESSRGRRRDDEDYDDHDYDSRRRDRSNETRSSTHRNRSRDRGSYRDSYNDRSTDGKHHRHAEPSNHSHVPHRHQRSPYHDSPPQYDPRTQMRPEDRPGNGNGSILPLYAQRQPPSSEQQMFRPISGSSAHGPSPPKPLYRGGYSRG